MEGKISKCGNCGHLMPKKGTVAENNWQAELINGICEMSGKPMSGALIAGCYYWCKREQLIKREGE